MWELRLLLPISTTIMSAHTIFCRFCGATGSFRYGTDRRRGQRYRCPHCHKTFTRRTHTIKSGSRLTDREWELAERLFVSRGGMSGADLARVLSYGKRTGQRLNRAFRSAVRALIPHTLPGASEWDEALTSGQWILGGVSRQNEQCLLRCIPNRREDTLSPLVEQSVGVDGLVFTDEWHGYDGIYRRMTVCHVREFVNRQARFVHTNTQEGIWGHMKELSRHVYRGFPKATLSAFLAEFMFRYNYRSYDTRLAVLSALLNRPKTNSLVV